MAEKPSSPRSWALRRGRRSQVGRVYLVTTTTHGRRPLFRDASYAQCVAEALRVAQECGDVETFAYVIMPDHLHWLFWLRAGTLSRVVGQMKAASAARINRLSGTTGNRVWQPGFYDHALRSEESLLGRARYVIENPVRSGLVAKPEDYPHWFCCWDVAKDEWRP